MDALLLIVAVLASLAFGVLMAYAVCLSFFAIVREHSIATARRRELPTPQIQVSLTA